MKLNTVISKLVLLLIFLLSSEALAADELIFSCKKAGNMPAARSNIALASYNNKIFICGGNDEKGAQDTAWTYEPRSGKFTELPAMTYPRFAHGAAVVDNKVYLLGGMYIKDGRQVYESAIEAYDPAKQQWQKTGKLPMGRARFGLAVLEGKLFLIGGSDEKKAHSSRVDTYDPKTMRWEKKNDLPYSCNRCSAVVCNGDLYLLGGEDSQGNTLQSVLKYCPRTDCWKVLEPMKTPRKNFAATVMGTKIITAGGWQQQGEEKTFHSSIEAFNPSKGEWLAIGSMETGRDGVRALNHNGTLFLFGGYNGRIQGVIDRGEWISTSSAWKINQELKFHLAYYTETPPPGAPLSPGVKPLGYTKDYEPDISNINLKSFLKLGFPVPAREESEKFSFYLKFYHYPAGLAGMYSAKKILSPLLIFHTAMGKALQQYLAEKENIVVKKGFIEKADYKFTPENPFPPLKTLTHPLEIEGKTTTAQEFFDSNIPFSSLYVKPVSPDKGMDKATESAQGVVAFHQEMLSLYRQTFREVKGSRSENFYYFINDSRCTRHLDSRSVVEVIMLPKTPMIFKNYKDLPMPQDRQHIFLSGLLLIYQYTCTLKENQPIIKDTTSLESQVSELHAHVFEVGSVLNLKDAD